MHFTPMLLRLCMILFISSLPSASTTSVPPSARTCSQPPAIFPTAGPEPCRFISPDRPEKDYYEVELKRYHTLDAHFAYIGVDLSLEPTFSYYPSIDRWDEDRWLHGDYDEDPLDNHLYFTYIPNAVTALERFRRDPGVESVLQNTPTSRYLEDYDEMVRQSECCAGNNRDERCIDPKTVTEYEPPISLDSALRIAERAATWARQPACKR